MGPAPFRQYHARYAWKLTVAASGSAVQALVQAIHEVWNVLASADNSFVIYPWAEAYANDENRALHNPVQCPTTLGMLSNYFERAYVKASGGVTYVHVHVGHNSHPQTLYTQTKYFFEDDRNKPRVGYYLRPLQCERVVEIGWLLGSTNYMEPRRLEQEIYDRSNGAFRVGCRNHTIATMFKGELPKEQLIRAMHIEVPHELQAPIKKWISHELTDPDPPFMGTAMRLVPLISAVSPGRSKEKCARLRVRQATFLHQLETLRCFEAMDIDYHDPALGGKSVRDLILKIPVPSDPSQQLFRAVDRFRDGYLFTFYSGYNQVARSINSDLLSYLGFLNPHLPRDNISKCFTFQARDRDAEAEWDPQRRVVKSAVVGKYQDLLNEFYSDHDVFAAVASLTQRDDGPLSTLEIQEFERLDKLRVQGMRHAEKHCRKLKMGAVPFSPQYASLVQLVLCWKLIVRVKDGRKVDSRHLSRALKKNNISKETFRSINLPEAKIQRNSAYKSLRIFSQSAMPSRQSWLENLSQARAEVGDFTAEQEYKSLIARERQRREARIIQAVVDPSKALGLTQIHQLGEDGSTVVINDKPTMESELIQELVKRFNQAAGTPFTIEPLFSLVGPLGVTPFANSILEGAMSTTPTLDNWTYKFLLQLKQVPSAPEIREKFPLHISTNEYSKGWEKMKERTSPGFSQLSFAQFKAASADPQLAEVDCLLSNLVYTSGYNPSRWCRGIDVMLQKQQGNFFPNKLRAILLFEPDFNQNNKRLGRDAMFFAEQSGSIAMEQFGSRKARSSIDQSLNKVLTFDLWRQFKCSGALCSNDAKSCYDRIVHSMASLCLQRLGVPQLPIISMFSTIQALKHHVRTLHGVSDQSFSGDKWSVPIQGVGQGNGAGPQIWAAVSTPILNMLRDEQLGTSFQSAISDESLFFVGYAFVDDVDLVVSTQSPSDPSEISQMMQTSLSAWEGGIHASGGAIVPEKSHWHLVQFKWVDGKPRYCSCSESPSEISVRDPNGVIRQLRRLEPWEADRTLGVRIAPDGNMQAQFLHMRQTACEWANKIRAGHLPRHLVHLAFTSTILRSLRYPLVATSLSESQCKAILAPLVQQVLPKIGVVRTCPTAVRQAPSQYLGLGFPNIYWLQGIDHIDRLVRYGSSNHLTGKLIRHSLEVMQLEVGSSQCVLSMSYNSFGLLVTPSWMSSTWQFLSQHNISVTNEDNILKEQRVNDLFLISIFYENGIRGKRLEMVNRCRIRLQVLTLSDITTGCGHFITLKAWSGIKDEMRHSPYRWPTQPELPRIYWEEWRVALSTLCSSGRCLRYPLGAWLSDSTTSFFYSPSSNRIYEKDNNEWAFWQQLPGRRNRSSRSRFGHKNTTAETPGDLQPATVDKVGPFLHLTGYSSQVPRTNEYPVSLVQYIIDSFPSMAPWILDSFRIVGSDLATYTLHTDNPLYLMAVSDGSFKNHHGTAAWTIIGPSSISWSGEVVTPGSSSVQSAYRSELAGIYCIIFVMFAIQQFYDLVDFHITVGCDGLGAINTSSREEDFVNPGMQHYDLILAIRRITMKLRGSVEWRHIKGHQDELSDTPLDEWALLNIEMDTKAKERWNTTQSIDESIRIQSFWCDAWRVEIDGRKICSNLQSALLDWLGRNTAIPFWSQKHDILLAADRVDWTNYSNAMRPLRLARKIWVTKWLADILPTGKNMLRWKFRESHACPRCLSPLEDSTHIILCPAPVATDLWSKQLNDLKQCLISIQTCPEASILICARLTAWREGVTCSITPSEVFGLNLAVSTQDALGWDKFMLGFLCLDWLSVQDQYYKFINCKRTGKRWATAIITKLWDIAWDFWDQRNEYLHNVENGILVASLNDQIHQEFLQGSRSLTASARQLMLPGEEAVKGYPLHIKSAWVARIATARIRYMEVHENTYDRERQVMARWLNQG